MTVYSRTWKNKEGAERKAWVVDYFYLDQQGKPQRQTRSFETKKAARDYEADVRIDVRKGIHIPPNRSITVGEAADRWLARVEAEGRERSTLAQYKQHAVLHIVPRMGRYRLAELTGPRVESFRDDLLANMSRQMARKVLVSFKSLLRAANYAHIADNVKIGQDKRGRRKLEIGRDIPTAGEVKRMIAAATDAKSKALLLTAALAGLRASELRGLRWSDVDLPAGELHIRQRADFRCVIGSPKSASSWRSIPLDAAVLVPALKAWKISCPPTEGDLVFPAASGQIACHTSVMRSLSRIMIRAGVVDKQGKPKYAPHAFRHFYASWCINPKDRGGRELGAKVVQSLLGHSSIVMTLDVYGHLFPRGDDREELAASARALLA